MRCATIALWLVAAAATAQEKDFETRYHEAYVLEVVDGDVAAAAKAYLELLREKGLPDRLAAQCRFRVAVTLALLGRADEGRARLAALAAEPGLPETLRAQVEEYRRTLGAMPSGSSLDRRLDQLKFELGRQPAVDSTLPSVYRDFEIIGQPAVPFLKELLSHPDRVLRYHAFRILGRLDVAGLGKAWGPRTPLSWRDFEAYLVRNPREIAAVESTLAKLDVAELGGFLSTLRNLPFKLDFVEAAAARGVAPESLMTLSVVRGGSPAARALLARWITGKREDLGTAAAVLYVDLAGEVAPELFPQLVRRLLGQPSLRARFTEVAYRQPAPLLLEVLDGLVAQGERWKGDRPSDPLASRLPSVLATAIDQHPDREIDFSAYEKILRRWAAMISRRGAGSSIGSHLRRVVLRKPPAEAAAFVQELFSGPDQTAAGRFAGVLALERASDVALIAAALQTANADGRTAIADRLGLDVAAEFVAGHRDLGPEVGRIFARLIEQRAIDPSDASGEIHGLAANLPPAEAQRLLDAFLAGGWGKPDEYIYMVAGLFWDREPFEDQAREERYRREVVIPFLAGAYERLDPPLQAWLVAYALWLLVEHADGKQASDPDPLGAFVAAHAEQLDDEAFDKYPDELPAALARVTRWVPLQAWVKSTGIQDWPALKLPADAVAQAARYFVEHPGAVNANVIYFLRQAPDLDVSRNTFDQLWAKADARLLYLLLNDSTASLVRPSTLDQVVERCLAQEAPLPLLAKLCEVVANTAPTEKLFPPVKRLLASKERWAVTQGVLIAGRLGHKDLMPALVSLLDSMDPTVRDQAQRTINAILDRESVKNDMRLRAAGLK